MSNPFQCKELATVHNLECTGKKFSLTYLSLNVHCECTISLVVLTSTLVEKASTN